MHSGEKRGNNLQVALKTYYSIPYIRFFISMIYVANEILLAIYLLFIPIQIAYYWLLSNGQNSYIQTIVDLIVLALFFMHILLYFDEKFYEIMKNPYAIVWKKILTVQFVYDISTLILAIYAVAAVKKSVAERIVEIIFFFKIYKLIKFDLKAMYFVIGTEFYVFYKIVRTLLIVFMAIAYVGSLFYGVAYILYINNVYVDMLWIVSCPAIQNCVDDPLIIQLEYAMYWALGTASTAAYGDISATEPTVVLVNIFALAFEGFLFGFYLNSMHSIPIENQKRQADLLHKFDSFQQHSSNRKLDNKLYLQILCSLQYSQSQKRSLQSIERVMPHKYIQQIKYNIFSQFLNKQEFFNLKSQSMSLNLHNKGNTQKNKHNQFLYALTDIVEETVCEINEDVYDYRNIGHDHLLFIREGGVKYFIASGNQQIAGGIGVSNCSQGDCFGVYGFFTGLTIPQSAICTNYSVIYSVNRSKFKQCLQKQQKYEFYQKFKRSIIWQQPLLLRQPLMNFIQSLSLNNCDILGLYNFQKSYQKLIKTHKQRQQIRSQHIRHSIKSQKVILAKTKSRNQSTQTQNLFQDDLLNFTDQYDEIYDSKSKSLDIETEKRKRLIQIEREQSQQNSIKKGRMSVFMIQNS